MKFLVLGAGAQGSACAFDLLQRPEVERVVLADLDVNEPKSFLKPFLGGVLDVLTLDATDQWQCGMRWRTLMVSRALSRTTSI